jgi:hypothetical protein
MESASVQAKRHSMDHSNMEMLFNTIGESPA